MRGIFGSSYRVRGTSGPEPISGGVMRDKRRSAAGWSRLILMSTTLFLFGGGMGSATASSHLGRSAASESMVADGWGQFGTDGGAHAIGDVPEPTTLSGASDIQASNSDDY